MLLFYSDNLKAAGSKAGTTSASLSALGKSTENVEVLQQTGRKTDPEIWAREAICKSLSFSN